MEVATSETGLLEVPVGLLKIGMYVAEVDRPWLETPFSVQGFFVESEEDIDYVAAHCKKVYVDPRQLVRKNDVTYHAPSTGPRNTTSLKNELRLILNTLLDDEVDSWEMRSDGSYVQRKSQSGDAVGCQANMIEHAQARLKSKRHKKLLRAGSIRQRN